MSRFKLNPEKVGYSLLNETNRGRTGKLFAMAELNQSTIRHALELARENGIVEVRLKVGEESFVAKLQPTHIQTVQELVVQDSPKDTFRSIGAPCVGYFRQSHKPLAVGQVVAKGDLVGAVDALGLANDVFAPINGEIVEVLVEPGAAVYYGQTLATIKVHK